MTARQDSFVDTASTLLENHTASGTNGGWAWTLAAGGISGGAIISADGNPGIDCATGDAAGSAYQCPPVGSADHFATTPRRGNYGNFNGPFAPCVRVVDASNYIGARYNAAAGAWEVYKKVSGTFTNLYQSVQTYGSETPKLQISGTSVTFYLNGVQQGGTFTVSDSVFSGVTTPGLVARNDVRANWIVSFQADVVGGTPATPQSGWMIQDHYERRAQEIISY